MRSVGIAATRSEQTILVREYYEKSARLYDSWMVGFDRYVLNRGRSRMCSRARGRTLEVAVGTGANFSHYPPDVSLTGIDRSPAMLALAERKARALDRDVDLAIGDAQSLAFPDAQFETVTTTLLLSTVPDPQLAAEEMRRVLRPGGRLLILDFARSPLVPVQWLQRAVAPLTARSRFSLLRDPLDYLDAVAFAVEHIDDSAFVSSKRSSPARRNYSQRLVRRERKAIHVELTGVGFPGCAAERVDTLPDLEVNETHLRDHLLPALTGQPACDSGSPKIDVLESFLGHGLAGCDVRELQHAART